MMYKTGNEDRVMYNYLRLLHLFSMKLSLSLIYIAIPMLSHDWCTSQIYYGIKCFNRLVSIAGGSENPKTRQMCQEKVTSTIYSYLFYQSHERIKIPFLLTKLSPFVMNMVAKQSSWHQYMHKISPVLVEFPACMCLQCLALLLTVCSASYITGWEYVFLVTPY